MFANIVSPIVWLGGMGLIFGGLLAYAAKKFEVAQDPKIIEVRAALPGANCGGCGYAGCDDLAVAVVRGEVKANVCPSMSLERLAVVSDILGTDAGNINRQKAVIMCGGVGEKSKRKFHYQGIRDCREAMIAMQGDKVCEFGCMGYGTCKKACVFDAIQIDHETGRVYVDESKCTGCGACEKVCPKQIIKRVPIDSRVHVFCKSNRKGKEAREVCTAACIGCGLCVKECKFGAIAMVDNLAVIDFEKCVNCGACVKKCPAGAIHLD